MDKIEVKIKRLSNTAIVPTYGSEKAAGLDLYADIGYTTASYADETRTVPDFITIQPHEVTKIGCGFAFQPPEGYAGYGENGQNPMLHSGRQRGNRFRRCYRYAVPFL